MKMFAFGIMAIPVAAEEVRQESEEASMMLVLQDRAAAAHFEGVKGGPPTEPFSSFSSFQYRGCNEVWEYFGALEDGKEDPSDVLLPIPLPELVQIPNYVEYVPPSAENYTNWFQWEGNAGQPSVRFPQFRNASAPTQTFYVETMGSTCQDFCSELRYNGYDFMGCHAGLDDAHWQEQVLQNWTNSSGYDGGFGGVDDYYCTVFPASSARSEEETHGKSVQGNNGCDAKWDTQTCLCVMAPFGTTAPF